MVGYQCNRDNDSVIKVLCDSGDNRKSFNSYYSYGDRD